MRTMRTAIGIALVLLGAGMADSDRLWVPVLVTALGIFLMKTGGVNDVR